MTSDKLRTMAIAGWFVGVHAVLMGVGGVSWTAWLVVESMRPESVLQLVAADAVTPVPEIPSALVTRELVVFVPEAQDTPRLYRDMDCVVLDEDGVVVEPLGLNTVFASSRASDVGTVSPIASTHELDGAAAVTCRGPAVDRVPLIAVDYDRGSAGTAAINIGLLSSFFVVVGVGAVGIGIGSSAALRSRAREVVPY